MQREKAQKKSTEKQTEKIKKKWESSEISDNKMIKIIHKETNVEYKR